MTNRQPVHEDFDALLDTLCDGELSAEQHQQLESMIRDDTNARRRYV